MNQDLLLMSQIDKCLADAENKFKKLSFKHKVPYVSIPLFPRDGTKEIALEFSQVGNDWNLRITNGSHCDLLFKATREEKIAACHALPGLLINLESKIEKIESELQDALKCVQLFLGEK